MPASFHKINYVIRPNKNVERKLIVKCLEALEPYFQISKYSYIGLGSIWFIDFILVHKILGISNMFSIEKPNWADRAAYNCPYKCIEVVPGDTTSILPELKFENEKFLIWLDYDKGIDGPVLEDIRIVTRKASNGSILIITINANVGQLPRTDDNGNDIDRETAIRMFAGDLVPHEIPPKALSHKGFPKFLSEIKMIHINNALKEAGRTERFKNLFNFRYNDTSAMVTIGGMIANDEFANTIDNLEELKGLSFLSGNEQFEINVPNLTPKEKLTIDRFLPSEDIPTEEDLFAEGFKIEKKFIDSYCKFYKYYPMFAEFFA
jgi:hypothetical protein